MNVSATTPPLAIQSVQVAVRIRSPPSRPVATPRLPTGVKDTSIKTNLSLRPPSIPQIPQIPPTQASSQTIYSTPSIPGGLVQPSAIVVSPSNHDPATDTHTTVSISNPEARKPVSEFHFDKVFGPTASQSHIYERMIRPIIDQCLAGYNGCIFVYGQTASGKTYTMQGPPSKQAAGVSSSVSASDDRGIILRVADQIVERIRQSKGIHGQQVDTKNEPIVATTPPTTFVITASFLEIYQEQLKDLLCGADQQGELRIRIDPDSSSGKDLYVEGLSERQLVTPLDYLETIEMGIKNRTVAETNMNEISSRSHSVLTLTIEQYQVHPSSIVVQSDNSNGNENRGASNGGNLGVRKRSKIHLIDLAGSERADLTGAVGTRLKEGSSINQSLSSLGNVINALSTHAKHVPYRDSKLTFLLSDSLGGNSLTAVIACVSPCAASYNETMSTLRFAERAKKVTNRVRVNIDPMVSRVLELEAEIARLRALIAKCTCGTQDVTVEFKQDSHLNVEREHATVPWRRRWGRWIKSGFKEMVGGCGACSTGKSVESQTVKTIWSIEEQRVNDVVPLPPIVDDDGSHDRPFPLLKELDDASRVGSPVCSTPTPSPLSAGLTLPDVSNKYTRREASVGLTLATSTSSIRSGRVTPMPISNRSGRVTPMPMSNFGRR
ncbi:hypothetical protein BASA50_009365 [Batrachochytrium salamandrivorans]|uniref:Kinesin-like protein n=1 Tax=Batrachochytrium salamandrivorans TaxID=1357716 RepID=A0ABQ8F4C9_9FUNG|nr:hypothetical protein BASA50_009365 [Batrachochytrium salamandrivorans]KAH9273179.1 hypothetical protein BASA83_004468 [Batrachochytrium salamandrivorans]KAJ1344629.1 hypothetical protein BSLG_000152 [Batrachochytrium salamandrivorans]